MSIALFAEPIEAEIDNADGQIEPCLLLGIRSDAGSSAALICMADGFLSFWELDVIRAKWRYDPVERDWIDHSGPPDDIEEADEP
jgi:hypothetical protein